MRPWRRTILAVAALFSLAGCNMVMSDRPMFTVADGTAAPTIRVGVWRDETPGCAVDERLPQTKWPPCATPTPGIADPPYWQVVAGEPDLLQIPIGAQGGTAPADYYSYLAFRPVKLDAQGRVIAMKMWAVQCGPPPPEPAAAKRRATTGADAVRDPMKVMTKSLLPGLKAIPDLGGCLAQSALAVRNAAKASEAWSPGGETSHWVRDPIEGDLPPFSEASIRGFAPGGALPKSTFAGNGPRRLWTGDCAPPATLSLDLSVYHHPGDFEQGDNFGWGLFYHPTPEASVALYDDGFSIIDRFAYPTPYVGWRYDGRRFSGPSTTFTYAPLPTDRAERVTVFDPAAQLGPPGPDRPFMNIFIDSQAMPGDEFAAIKACLTARRLELNAALAKLPTAAPYNDQESLTIKSLGGISYGPPPYDDPGYMAALARMRGSTVIPKRGRFLLYPGGSATGTINGHSVRIYTDGVNNPGIDVDGKPLEARSNGKTNVGGIWAGPPWRFDGPPCQLDRQNCGREITLISDNDDQSETFEVSAEVCQGIYLADFVPWECNGEKKTKRH